MSKNEGFNPKQHEEVGEGTYVQKSAADELKENEALAEIAKAAGRKNITAVDLLHQDALSENKQKEAKTKKDQKRKEVEKECSGWVTAWLSHMDKMNSGGKDPWIKPEERRTEPEQNLYEKLSQNADPATAVLKWMRKKDELFTFDSLSVGRVGYDRYVPPELLADKAFATAAIKIDPRIYVNLSSDLKEDENIFGLAWEESMKLWDSGDDTYEPNPLFPSLSGVPTKFRSRDVVRHYVLKINGGVDNLKFAPDELKNDKELILSVLAQEPAGLGGHLGARKKYGGEVAMKYADPELQKDKDFVLKAVVKNPLSLEFVSPELKKDNEVVLRAVVKDIHALKYADAKFRGDKNFIADVFQKTKNPEIIREAVAELGNDKEFILRLMEISPKAYAGASREIRLDRDFALRAVTATTSNFSDMPLSFQSDDEFVLEAIKLNAKVFEEVLDSDHGVKFADRRAKNLDFIRKALVANRDCIKYIPANIKARLRDF